MSREAHLTYPPLNTLKQVCDEVWIVDGPVIRFGPSWFKAPFSTRATIVRLDQANLFVHSPTPLVPELRAEVEQTGMPRWIVGPNRLHYWWIPDWHDAYPDAEIYLAPRTREQSGDRLTFEATELDQSSGYPWDEQIATLPVAGSFMTEIVFFHRRSRTLVLTDLIENFEPDKVESLMMKAMIWAGGVRDPDGSMPRDMRMTFSRCRAELKVAVETMIGWNPGAIILAHGRWYDRDGRSELQRAFRWLLD